MSLARAELDLANVALEDVILGELGGNPISRDDLSRHLKASMRSLQGANHDIHDLAQNMGESGYKDLPTLKTLNLEEVGERLTEDGLVEIDAWGEMLERMRAGTFFANLVWFKTEVEALLQMTTSLLEKFDQTKSQSLSEVAEENQPSNFKASFACLYTAWSRFHSRFLASSLLSTEIWYAYMDYGSLVNTKGVSV